MAVEVPLPKDESLIKQLLSLCELPQEDITPEHLRHFFVLKEKGQVIGVVGTEVFGQFSLLRSLAVHPGYRRRGFASQLLDKAEEYGASLKIETFYLLTMKAETFFSKRGYQRVQRDSAPPSIQGTTEFKNLCPASSICMMKHLKMQ